MKNTFLLTLSFTFLLSSCSNTDSWFGDKKTELSGERIRLITESQDLKKDQINANQKLHLSSPINNKIFNALDFENGNNFSLAAAVKESYTIGFNSSLDFNLVTTPILVENQLIIMDATGNIICYEISSGNKLWENNEFYNLLGNSFFKNDYLNGGLFYANNKIFATAGINKIISIDINDGKTLWLEELSGAVRATPTVVNGKIHLKSIDNKIYTLNAENGKAEWSFLNVNEEINVLNALNVQTNHNLLVTYNNSDEIIALNRNTGEEIWATSAIEATEVSSSQKTFFNIEPTIQINDEHVYISDKHGDLSSLDVRNGEKLWKKKFFITKSFWVCGDFIFAVSNNDKLIALNRYTGALEWIANLPNDTKESKFSWSSPIVINSKIAVNNTHGALLFFNSEDGSFIEQMEIPKDVQLPPLVVNENMFIISDQGRITYYSK